MTGSFVLVPQNLHFLCGFCEQWQLRGIHWRRATVSSATNVIGPNPFPSVGPVSGFPLASQVSTNLGIILHTAIYM